MDPVTLSATPPAAPPAAPAAPAAVPDLATLQAELATLKTQVAEKDRTAAELKRTAEHWYEKANARPAEPTKPAPPEEPDVDVLDLATKGGKAFEKYLEGWAKKNGYVRGDEMTAAMDAKAAELSKQGDLVARYPDLKKNDSEFFKATAAAYGDLKKRGYSEVDAMEIAAERTELQMLREGKLKTPKQQEEDAKAQREADRRTRAAAGAGERGSRAAADTEDDDTLSEDDERAVRQLADGLEIPLDQARERYIKRAKAGVRVALKLDRRNR